MALGFGLLGNLNIHESTEIAQRAEELGYDSLWFAEHNFSRDGVSALAVAAMATKRMMLGPAVVPIFTRSALLLANTFASLDEIAKGRMVLGVGAGSRVLIKAQGIAYEKPLVALREYVEVCRLIWNTEVGQHISYEGQMLKLEDAELDFAPHRRDIPVYLGPTGPKACALSGEIGDGALLNAFLPASYAIEAKSWIAEGAASVGRKLDSFDIAMLCVTCVADSKEEAHDYLRPMIASYLTRLPDIAKHTSIWGDEWERLAVAVNQGGGEAGAKYISDELLDEITICGNIDDCRKSYKRYRDAGIDHVILFSFGDERRALESLTPEAMA